MREWEVALKMIIYKSFPHLFIIVYLFVIVIKFIFNIDFQWV